MFQQYWTLEHTQSVHYLASDLPLDSVDQERLYNQVYSISESVKPPGGRWTLLHKTFYL